MNSELNHHVTSIVQRSGTSFAAGMRLLSRERRFAIYAVYAFCREIDDIADTNAPADTRKAALAIYRRAIDDLYRGRDDQTPTFAALAAAIRHYDLPQAEFIALMDGMDMDINGQMIAPCQSLLQRYCRCVAGAVGILSVRVFGVTQSDLPQADAYAKALGEALQKTNIVRDPMDDLQFDRLYVPRELLDAAGISATTPATILAHVDFPTALSDLATRAQHDFNLCDTLLSPHLFPVMRPALLMADYYQLLLNRLSKRGFVAFREPITLPLHGKLVLFLRHFVPYLVTKAR